MAASAGRIASLLGLTTFASLYALASLAMAPSRELASTLAPGVVSLAAVAAAAAYTLPRMVAAELVEALNTLAPLYTGKRHGMRLGERVMVVEAGGKVVEAAASLSKLSAAWPLTAACLAAPGAYIVAAVYSEAYQALEGLQRFTSAITGSEASAGAIAAPRPQAVGLLLALTLGLASPLAGRWLTWLLAEARRLGEAAASRAGIDQSQASSSPAAQYPSSS